MAKAALGIDLNGLDVLVVEDDAASALLVAHALSKHGARVDTASNGSEALTRFEEKRYPVVVTDICMPGMDGLELVERIRQLDKNTQIIATSAHSETDCLISAIELGFNDYFLKPLKIEKLLWAVKRCADTNSDRQRLEDEREKFRAVVESLGEGITIKDLEYRIQYQNKAMTKMFGERAGSACYTVFGLDSPCHECPTIKTLKDGKPHSSCRNYQLDGTSFNIESTASLLRDSRGTVTGTVEIIRDIGERTRNEQIMRDMAFLDPLTGLPNRRLFEDRLVQAIAKSRRYGKQFGLLTLDLDNFKEINDSFGHEAGDQVLREAADRIKNCCKRDLDTISRHGGDEFCVIITDCGGKEQLSAIVDQLLVQFAQPFQLAGSLVKVTTSIGISIFPDNGTERKELEIASDRAMYAAKKAGRNTYRFWEPYPRPRPAF
jgi:diguanylate cyclase (GGDEF)-like protein/PAS domain S-box-containing protein